MPNMLISTGRALLQSNPDVWPEYRDNFDVGATPGAGWIGTTGTIAGGKLTITPTLGGNLLVDPGLEAAYAGGLCGSLTKGGAPTLAESADVHGGSKAQAFTGTASGDTIYWAFVVPTATDWYTFSVWGKRTAGANADAKPTITGGGGAGAGPAAITSAAYTKILFPYQALTTAVFVARACRTLAAAWDAVIVDDGDLEKITYPSMFLTREYKTTEVIAGATINHATGSDYTQAGVVIALDSPTNPQNYVVGYYDGLYLKMDLVLARVVTNKISVTCGSAALYNWNDGELLEIRRTGNVFSLWYGGRQLGTNQTIADVAIVNNRYVGLYSQSALTTFNDFDVRTYGTDYRIPDYSAYTPATYTAGQGIISMRFDDTDHDSYDYVLGELTSRSLTGSFAIIRGSMNAYTSTNTITLANLLAIQAAGNEITCHGLQHLLPTSWADWVRETSQAAEELRRLGCTIWTWTQPGYADDPVYNLDGTWCYGQKEEAYVRRYFMAYEAYVIPVPANPYWPLPRASHWGPTPGPSGSTTTLAQFEAMVDEAIAHGTGIVAAWHPVLFDTGGGNWTKADFEDALDYVETAVTAGDLVCMTITDQLFAVQV